MEEIAQPIIRNLECKLRSLAAPTEHLQQPEEIATE